MFWEPRVREELRFIFFLCLVNANFEDKIFIREVDYNTRNFFLKGRIVIL